MLVQTLHPMECIYVILNSTSTDLQPHAWFDDDLGKAYSIYEYIVRWINWKVTGDSGDELYYETYFIDYDRQERKRIMTLIGADMLRFIETHPRVQSIEMVNESLTEIVPLLESDHLVILWKFYGKLLVKDGIWS